MVALALGAGEHGGVIGQHRAARALRCEQAAVDGAGAGDQAVGRGVGDQVGLAAPARLCRQRQAAVFAEAAGIAQVVDVLARGAQAARMAACHRLGAGRVVQEGMAVEHALQVGADRGRVGVLGFAVGMGAGVGRLQHQHDLALGDLLAGSGAQVDHAARVLGHDGMFHLHRIEHGHGLAGLDQVVLARQFDHAPVHRRAHRAQALAQLLLEACRAGRCRHPGGAASRQGLPRRVLRGNLRGAFQQGGQRGFHIARMHVLAGKVLALGQRPQQVEVGGDAADIEFPQRALQAPHGVSEVVAGGGDDQLGQQRVVVRGRCIAGIAVGVDAHVRPGGRIETLQPPLRRPCQPLRVGGLGIHAHLDGKAAHARRVLRVQPQCCQAPAFGQPQLHGHQVHAGDLLGDGVFDLQARVGFDKDKGQGCAIAASAVLAVLRFFDQEFKRAQAAVARFARERAGGIDNALTQRRIQRRAGRDLDHFLETALQRAVTLAQCDHVVAVAGDLHFDMARAGHQPLGVDGIDAEGRARLGAAARIRFGQGVALAHHAHAAPAAAAHRLEHHAGAVLLVEEGGHCIERGAARSGGHHRYAAACGQRQRAALVAEQGQLLGLGADKDDLRGCASAGKVGALAEKTIARVDGVAAGGARCADDGGNVEIGGGPLALQRDSFVGQQAVPAGIVVGGIDRHGGDAKVSCGALHAQRDLATIGDQELLHKCPLHAKRHRASSVAWPASVFWFVILRGGIYAARPGVTSAMRRNHV
ncbi:hypothetical protein D9M72_365650 [compost metagenome]